MYNKETTVLSDGLKRVSMYNKETTVFSDGLKRVSMC